MYSKFTLSEVVHILIALISIFSSIYGDESFLQENVRKMGVGRFVKHVKATLWNTPNETINRRHFALALKCPHFEGDSVANA